MKSLRKFMCVVGVSVGVYSVCVCTCVCLFHVFDFRHTQEDKSEFWKLTTCPHAGWSRLCISKQFFTLCFGHVFVFVCNYIVIIICEFETLEIEWWSIGGGTFGGNCVCVLVCVS